MILSGCASQESPAVATLRHLAQGTLLPSPHGNSHQLDRRFQYLRVQYNKLPSVYMALGYVDYQGSYTVQTWYSADGEVIQLAEGRVIGTVGLPHDWSHVNISALPRWSTLANGQPATYSRQRDSQVGYVYNEVDRVQAVRRPADAASPLPPTAPQLPATAWWVEETTPALPTAYVAVLPTASGPQWVYSYQCLTPQVCLGMQPWPPAFTGP